MSITAYKQVQLIGWGLHTGPIRRPDIGAYDYSGLCYDGTDRRIEIEGQCLDIEARVAFTKDAIEKAYAIANRSEEVLKVFVGPEFLYRGGGGAYLHDLINGWEKEAPYRGLMPPFDKHWPGLYGNLKSLVRREVYKDWVFVFGTAVSASFKTTFYDKVSYIDLMSDSECYNTSLIQKGGIEAEDIEGTHVVTKHLKSLIDFISYRYSADIHTNSRILPLDPNSIIPLDVVGEQETSAVFELPNVYKMDKQPVRFGLEICLDHCGYKSTIDPKSNTLIQDPHGRLRNNHQFVDLQLVPSGGMALEPKSICLLPEKGDKRTSYAFNCDGLTCIGTQFWGAHMQIWNQSDGNIIKPANKLFEENFSSQFVPKDSVRVTDKVTILNMVTITDELLWRSTNEPDAYHYPSGSGYVRAFPALNFE